MSYMKPPEGYTWLVDEDGVYGKEAYHLARTEINVLRNREILAIVVDQKDTVCGVLFVASDKESFTFDIVIHEDHRRRGLGRFLVRLAKEEYFAQKDAFPDMVLDVQIVNPIMKTLLLSEGFHQDPHPFRKSYMIFKP